MFGWSGETLTISHPFMCSLSTISLLMLGVIVAVAASKGTPGETKALNSWSRPYVGLNSWLLWGGKYIKCDNQTLVPQLQNCDNVCKNCIVFNTQENRSLQCSVVTMRRFSVNLPLWNTVCLINRNSHNPLRERRIQKHCSPFLNTNDCFCCREYTLLKI